MTYFYQGLPFGFFIQAFGEDDNNTNVEIGIVSNRGHAKAERQTSLRGSFRSDHLVDAFGADNPADKFIGPDGEVYYGRISKIGKVVSTLSAEQVYSKKLLDEVRKATKEQEQQEHETLVAADLNGAKLIEGLEPRPDNEPAAA